MYKELENKVIEWANDKGILSKANPMAQGLKTLEEVNELLVAINTNDREEIKDSLGDILVTIIIQSKMQDIPLMECLQSAYNIISKRNGKMINGTFVKNE